MDWRVPTAVVRGLGHFVSGRGSDLISVVRLFDGVVRSVDILDDSGDGGRFVVREINDTLMTLLQNVST